MSAVVAGAGYEYVVLRCVPRADREEFLNVGVVLHCQGHDFLDVAWHLDADRLRCLDPVVDLGEVESALRYAAAVCVGGTGTAAGLPRRDRFGYLKAPRSTVLRPGPVHGGLTRDPAETLHRLLGLLVR